MAKRSRKFKTEVQQLLDLVVHSLYSKKEIFLRELISNASDAIDRAKFEALTDPAILEDASDWKIEIRADKKARTLTISDNGIGMQADEVETNIGTIANSGTRKFLEQLRQSKDTADAELIGQFGVGFYASFMVADRVTVETRRAGTDAEPVRWASAGEGTYTLEPGTRDTRGTAVTLHLREDQDEFLDEWRIRSTVKAYSDYIGYPIFLEVVGEEKDEKDKTDEKEGDEKAEKQEPEPLNSMKAIWRRDRKEVKEEEYKEFYTHISHDHHDPLETVHYKVEGQTEFRALLFIPGVAPFDLFMRERIKGLHLYVKNVFITDDCKALLPEYLRFVKGVVDSSDLPLNVSREILQDDALIRRIRRNLVGKILGALKDMLEKRPDDYRTFFTVFGNVLKEGLPSDFENHEKLLNLMMYPSTAADDDQRVTLKEYKERMPSDQEAIYYLSAENLAAARNSPHLEIFKKKSWEVLLWADPIDEWVADSVREYDGKPLKAIDRGDLDVKDVPEAEKAEGDEDFLKRVQAVLDEDVREVRFSQRLTDSPCCLVTDAQGVSPAMERLMAAMNQPVPKAKRILELNPSHPVVARLKTLFAADAEGEPLANAVHLLYGQALILEGTPVKDPARFARLLSDMMAGE